MRDLLLGVRFIQADGVVTWGGAKVVKSVTGYDVPKLLVGSLGTLGVLGELTLRLHPLPEVEATGLRAAAEPGGRSGLGGARSWTRRCSRTASSGSTPARWRRAGCRRPPAALAISIGSVEPAVRAQQAAIAAIAAAGGARRGDGGRRRSGARTIARSPDDRQYAAPRAPRWRAA